VGGGGGGGGGGGDGKRTVSVVCLQMRIQAVGVLDGDSLREDRTEGHQVQGSSES
jgi:hypothetical protein